MPRKLPWLQKGGSSSTVPRPRPTSISKPPTKRVKLSGPISDLDEADASKSSKEAMSDVDMMTSPSTSPKTKIEAVIASSPLPEPPFERYMDEGIDCDDKYRMVEDEFFSIAQRFTAHLHAAEYKRQQKMVKTRNAEAINSISRPVTGKMPGHTKRRVQSVAKSLAQRKVLESAPGTKSGNAEVSDESDGDGLPYVGTTLHGLMDSPRGKSRSLAVICSPSAATRFASGYQKPTTQFKDSHIKRSPSPVAMAELGLGFPNFAKDDVAKSTNGEDDDDDLDAPRQAPKISSFNREKVSVQSRLEDSRPIPSTSKATPISTETRLPYKTASSRGSTYQEPPLKPKPAFLDTVWVEPEGNDRIACRLGKARSQRAKQEKEEREKRNIDIIPSFL